MATDLKITMEDRPGMLATLGEALGGASVNIDGGCAVTGDGSGEVHILVEDAAAARAAIEAAGFTVDGEREVILVDVADQPGELGKVTRKLAEAGVNVELLYLAAGSRLVLGVDNAETARSVL